MNNVEAPHKKPRCQYISKIGSRCQADPQTGKAHCFFHDPDQKSKQAAARRQGGEARSRQTEPEITLPPNLPVIRLQKASDVFELLSQTVNHFRRGEMDIRAAKAIAYLASLLLRALKANTQPSVAELLADTINQFRCGQVELRAAKTIGHLASLMLGAIKQAILEEQAASGGEATRPAGAIRQAQAVRPEAPRHDSIEAATTPIVPSKPLKDHEPHPAVLGMTTVNPADHPQARHA